MPKAGWNDALAQLFCRADVAGRIMVEARVETAADIRQRYDQWQNLDQPLPANVELLPDGGVRLRATANAGPANATITAYARSHFDPGGAPFFDPITNDSSPTKLAALIEWSGSESPQAELGQVQAWLNPQYDLSVAKTVAYFQLELYHIFKFDSDGDADMYPLLPAPMKAAADGQAAGFVTWDFTALASRPRPKQYPTQNPNFPVGGTSGLVPGFRNGLAHTLVVISARQADGSAASNVGWGYDGAHGSAVSGAGSSLYGAVVKGTRGILTNPWGINVRLSNTTPGLNLILGTHTPATVTFSGAANRLTFPATPKAQIELVLRGEVPTGTTLIGQVLDDAAVWQPFTDGQFLNQVPGTFALGTYTGLSVRATLTQNAAGDRSPILRGLGARVVTPTDLSDVCEVVSASELVDPQDLHAEVSEFQLRANHDGERDFRDAITQLLASTPLNNLLIRLSAGHPKLARDKWMHLQDGFLDDPDFQGPHVTLTCLGPLCLVRGVLPVLTSQQDFLPNGDSSNPGAWTKSGGATAPFWTLLADNQGGTGLQAWDDSTYVASPTNPNGAILTVTLPATGAPNANLGPNLNVVVQFRYALLPPGNNGPCLLTVTLFKNGIGIGATTVLATSTQVQTGTLTLTAAGVAQLGDGSGLQLGFNASAVGASFGFPGGPVLVTWARLSVLPLRSALVYPTPTPADVVAQDLLAGQLGVEGRYQGPGIPSAPGLPVGKTIAAPANGASPDLTIAPGELAAVGNIAGGAWIGSQGRVEFVPFFDPTVDPVSGAVTYTPHQASPVAIIPREEIAEPISVTPGYRYRVPLFDAWWGWNDATQSWQGEAHGVALAALNAFGPARLMAQRQLSDRIAKWVQSQGLANGLVQRQVQALGFGQLTWRFRTTYAHPELKLGDPVAIESDRFIGYDPTALRGIAGPRMVTGYVVGIFDIWGRDLCLWVPTWASIGAGGGVQVASQAPAPNPAALTLNVQATARAGGMLVVSWSGGPAVKSVRVAVSNVAAAPVPTGASDALSDSMAGGGGTALSPGPASGLGGIGTGTAPEAGLAAAPSRLGGIGGSGAPPAGSGTVLVGQSGQTPLGPFAFADLIYVTVTPYATIDGTGAQGPAVSTQVRMLADPGEHDPIVGLRPRFQKLLDGLYPLVATNPDGSTSRSSDINPQGSVQPTPVTALFITSVSGGATSGHMWCTIFSSGTATIYRPDGTTIAMPGTVAVGTYPSVLPSLSQVAGGALGARTRFVRIAYVKSGFLYMGATNIAPQPPGAEATLAVNANNLLTVKSPPAVAGFDGWVPLVGSVTSGEFTQPQGAPGGPNTPVPFGTDWTEPVGGATVAGTTPWKTDWGSFNSFQGGATAVELLASTKYFFYPYYDLATGLLLLACPTGVVPTALDGPSAQLQCADGHIAVTNLGSMTATLPIAGGSGSGVASSGQTLGGSGGKFL